MPRPHAWGVGEWFDDNSTLLVWATIASAVVAVVTIVVVVVVVVRLPADYFLQKKRHRLQHKHPKGNLVLRIARNILGWLLIAAGIAMLFLPGQGVLVLFIGVMLAEFPGKYRLERWIISRGKVHKTINWLRRKFDRPPLRLDHESSGTDTTTGAGERQPA